MLKVPLPAVGTLARVRGCRMLGLGEARATPLYARAPAIPPCIERCFFIVGLEADEAPETGGRRERESGYCWELTEEEREPGREEEREASPEVV